MTEDTLNDTERERSWRITLAERAWGWHEADGETIAGYGHHMSQMLYRLPRDGQTDDMRVSIEQMLDDLRALARDRDALAAKITRVEALYGGEPPPVWIKGTKIVRATARNERLGCDVTESLLRVSDVRAALAGPEDTARDTQRDNEGSGSVKGCGYCGYAVGHTTDECVRVSKPPARPVPADHGTDRADEEGDA